MRSALLVLLCVGIVEARRDCKARYAVTNPLIDAVKVTNGSITTSSSQTRLLVQPMTSIVVDEPETIIVTQAPITCPEVEGKNKFHLSYLYKNKPRCLGLHNIPASTKSPADLAAICKKLHPDAVPASFHSADEARYAKSIGFDGGVMGTYLPAGKPLSAANLVNQDGEPVDFHPYINTSPIATAFQLVSPGFHVVDFKWYISRGDANAICSLWL
uniref:SCP domain-containing protein n=1 Tax=Panagrellus redivivus TaxID=6233 RepID=A0A7E4VNH9_PANRE